MKLPQLSLRELFLLVVIAAMGCGWWVEHRARIATESEARTLRLEADRNGEQLNALMAAADPGVGTWLFLPDEETGKLKAVPVPNEETP